MTLPSTPLGPAPTAPLTAAIIDLDGTLVDTLGDFVLVLHLTLRDLQVPPERIGRIGRAFVESTVGKGTEHLLAHTLAQALDRSPLDASVLAMVEPAWKHYQDHYIEHNGTHSAVFEGVCEGLQRLRDHGVPLACLTNKPRRFAEQLLEHKGLRGHFQQVFGGDSFARKKPDPLPLLETCKALGSAPEHTLMVGDSSNDAQAAHAARCPAVLVTYGYNHGRPITEVPALAHLGRLDALDLTWFSPAR